MTKSFIRYISDPKNQNSWALKFRRNRFRLYQELTATLSRPYTVLDVGGTEEFWMTMGYLPSSDFTICIVNLSESSKPSYDNVELLKADACNLRQFGERQFDVVFSNSVLEHVGDASRRQQMASEILRVGRRYFVQTPNRYFPIDPHFPFPFFQFYNRNIQALLLRTLPLAWVGKIKNKEHSLEVADSVSLIGRREFESLFPGCYIFHERVFGLTKSFVAYGGWD